MGFQDFNSVSISIFTIAHRFFHYFKQLFTIINTRYFPSSSSDLMQRSQRYWRTNQDVQGMEEACTSRYYISPRPGNQYQASEVTETTQIRVRSVRIVENLDFAMEKVRENQAIKQQKLEGGRIKQIVKANHLNLPHKLKPDTIGSEADSGSSSSKEGRKVYIRQTTTPSPSVADMVKRFESRTGQVYIQQTVSLSSSTSHSTSVTDMVKQFESKTSETGYLGLEGNSGNSEELQNEEHFRQRMGPVNSQYMNSKAQLLMKNHSHPVHKVGTPLREVMVDMHQRTEENMYKRYIEESESAKKMKEERVVKKQIRHITAPKENENMKVEKVVQKLIAQTMAHKEKENICPINTECASATKLKDEGVVRKQVRKMKTPKEKESICRGQKEESASAKKMKEWKVVQKRIMKTMVLNARSLPKFDSPSFLQRMPKETATPKSPNLWFKKQSSISNCSPCSSPASKVR